MTNPNQPQKAGQVFEDDPFGAIKSEKGAGTVSPSVVKAFHARSDVDSSQQAQHHTLGNKHDQSAAGDHNHDGKGSRKIGEGLVLSVSGSKGGNVALANLITMLQQVIAFTDNTT